MANYKKYKNRKINLEKIEQDSVKQKEPLKTSWKIALTSLFLIAIPSFLLFLLLGKDGWIFSQTKSLHRWAVEFPIALAFSIFQIGIVSLLIWKFKVLPVGAFAFLMPLSLAMNSFLVSSGVTNWILRVLPAVGLGFVAIPIIAINKKIRENLAKKKQKIISEEEKQTKSLLD
ncbi:Uncharacterised protein [Metamycoplasma arthritidis]|uniref:hypothetical protein n=1 Tax=Metamycoplasma arthritidis TaxID=2111 RepID=UPI0010051F15|nr:hypothetical protein [Metamycoplasma arthritidis]VEU79018.1 Uncharacterised protein [Metamycoplasma arthritidis]